MKTPLVQALAEWPESSRAPLRGVFFDIDDTLTSDGRLTAEAYSALERLFDAKLVTVAITGRPAGWCDHIARMWPVDAVVGENGAFYFRYDGQQRRMQRRFMHEAAERARQRERLHAIGADIIARVPGSAIAADQLYRDSDLAIDYCEDVARVGADALRRIVKLMTEHGLTAKVSSIHVNGWFGTHDKLSTTRLLMRECHSIDIAVERALYAFIGDSPNDTAMFGFFPNSVGVANVREFEHHMATAPRYVTQARTGAGFREFADAILAAKDKI